MLRDEIDNIIREIHTRDISVEEAVDRVLALIDGQRCRWTLELKKTDIIIYNTSCGKQAVTWSGKDFNECPHCQSCGKRVEVVEGER